VVVDRGTKAYSVTPSPVFSRGERLARLRNLILRIFGAAEDSSVAGDAAPAQAVLTDISLNVGAGAVLGIYGEEGAGKTTLLRIIAGLERLTSGRVAVLGRVAGVFRLTEGACHRHLTVRENIVLTGTRLGLGREWLRRNLASIAEYANLTTALRTPLGMIPADAYWRFAWALAVRCEPQVLLLDQMPRGLDACFEEDVRREIAERSAAGCTVIVSDSYPGQLSQFCSRVIRLERGGLVDPPSDVPTIAAAAPSPSASAEPRGRSEWHWVACPQEGWAAYLYLAPPNVQKRQLKGQRLTPARPPWLDAHGGSPLEPWWPEPQGPPQPAGKGYSSEASCMPHDLELV
jgi:ABC-type polysaccharide/polyol phosphate transport system ATPase subunit